MSSLHQELRQLIDERMQMLNSQPYHILVVDDEPAMSEMVAQLLKSEPYIFVKASDGIRALEVLETQGVQLILSDIRMPNMHGTEFVETIRSRDNETPVIFMTAYADQDTLLKAIRLQPLGFIEKPFDVKALRMLVSRAYKEHIRESAREMQALVLTELVEQKTRDISFRTDLLMAEQRLLQGIISQATFGIIAVDTNANVHLVNDYAIKRTMQSGVQSANCCGQHLAGLLSSDLESGFMQMFTFALTKSDRQERSFQCSVCDQALQVVAYPITFRSEVTAIVFVVHDITNQENLQRRLVQSAKLASIGELAAGVAHEINNPIGFVTSNISTLGEYWQKLENYFGFISSPESLCGMELDAVMAKARDEYDLDYIREDVPALLTETSDGLSRVAKIVSDLKTFARADNPHPELGDLIVIIEDSLNLCRNVTKYNLEIERDFGTVPLILCYPAQLVQVFTNLIVNAAHATLTKGKLYISADSDAQEINVRFRDTGTGIAPDVLPRIFDPFFTTKDPGKGTGMGLSISYGIVQRHGGTISVNSIVGEGTEFIVKLPIQSANGIEAENAVSTERR